MKTISSRMTAIKDMKAFDSEGEAINNVEKSLKEVNVDLRDGNGHFRDMQDVLMELSSRWDTFSTENQMFIAQQIGGVRQQNIVLALLSNEVEIRKQLTAETNSNGLVLERYGIYLKSVEAAQNEWTASWEKLATSGVTKGLIVDTYELGASILDLISDLGGLPVVLELATVALVLFNQQLIITNANSIYGFIKGLINIIPTLISMIGNLTVASSAFNTVIAANPIGAFIIAITSVLAIFSTYKTQIYDNISVGLEENMAQMKAAQSQANTTFNAIENFNTKLANIKKAKSDWLGFIVVDDRQLIKDSLIETEKAVRSSATSWKEYKTAMDEVTKASGFLIDKDGEVYKQFIQNGKEYRTYIEGIITYTEKAFNSIEDNKLEDLRAGRGNGNGNINPKTPEFPTTSGTSEYDAINQAATDSFNKKVSLEQQFTLIQVDEAIKRAEALGVSGESQLESLRYYRDEVIKANMDINGEFNQTAEASKQTMEGLAQAIYSQAQSANQVLYDTQGNVINSANGVYLNLIQSNVSFSAFVKQLALDTGKTAAEIYAMFSQYAGAMSQFGKGEIPFSPEAPKIFSSGGGGGGGGKTAEQKRLEKEIKILEDKKKHLQDVLDEFNKYIDAQKEMLKLQKEEKAFTDDLMKKNKSLAKIKAEIAILALDNSEEAKAKRLKLEEDAAAAEEDIAKTTEERNYTVKIEALDQQKKAFEENINDQMKKIDDKISKLQDESKAIESTGGAVGGVTGQWSNQQTVVDKVVADVIAKLNAMNLKIADSAKGMDALIRNWVNTGMTSDQALQRAIIYYRYIAAMKDWEDHKFNPYYIPRVPPEVAIPHHDGIESGFVGKLKSNEEFAKLLNGELVVNKSQMDNFMTKILPNFAGAVNMNSNMGNRGINISMPINVAGNLDKSIIPDLEKLTDNVVKKLNDVMKQRGYIRQTSLTSI